MGILKNKHLQSKGLHKEAPLLSPALQWERISPSSPQGGKKEEKLLKRYVESCVLKQGLVKTVPCSHALTRCRVYNISVPSPLPFPFFSPGAAEETRCASPSLPVQPRIQRCCLRDLSGNLDFGVARREE